MWVQLVIFVICYILSRLLAPKTPQQNNSPGAPTVAVAKRGNPISVIFGYAFMNEPNVVWFGDLYIQDIKSKSGGKK